MATITQKELLNQNAAQFAVMLRAFDECSREVQDIVREMTEISISDETTPDEKMLANDAIVEALFPSLAADVCEHDDLKCSSQEAKDALADLALEEEAFADKVRLLMDERGINQEKLARMTSVTQSAISNMLNRRCRPQGRTIARFAEVLGVEPSELWPESK